MNAENLMAIHHKIHFVIIDDWYINNHKQSGIIVLGKHAEEKILDFIEYGIIDHHLSHILHSKYITLINTGSHAIYALNEINRNIKSYRSYEILCFFKRDDKHFWGDINFGIQLETAKAIDVMNQI